MSDRLALASMRALLWPETSAEEHLKEVDALLSAGSTGTLPFAILVSHHEDGALTGFSRSDYALMRTGAILDGRSALWKAGSSTSGSDIGESAAR